MAIDIQKVNEDNRGSVYGYKIGKREHIIVTFHKGMARGGHYHHDFQWHIILAGRIRALFRHMKTGKEWEETLVEGDAVHIAPMVSHLFIAEEEAVVAESHLEGAKTTNYPPQRKLAEPK